MKKMLKILLIMVISSFFTIVYADGNNIYWAIEGRSCYGHNSNCSLLISNSEFDDNSYEETGRGDSWKNSGYKYEIKSVIIGNENDVIRPTNMSGWFEEMYYVKTIDFTYLDTSNVTDMSRMFSRCDSLEFVDVSNFDTSNVSDMGGMFGAKSLISLDLSNFDTSNVTNMSGMFSGTKLITLDLSNFDTSNVTNMSGMFLGTKLIALDLNNFDTSNVTDMSYMFSGMKSLIGLNLSNFDTSNVINMSNMFAHTYDLSNLNISSFNTLNVTDMSYMFSNARSLKTLDLSNFDTSNVTNMSNMFSGMQSLRGLNLSDFDTSNVINMSNMFAHTYDLSNLNISSFNTLNVTDMSYMFSFASALNTLDLNNFDTSNVTDMSYMFSNARSLKTLDLSNFDTSNVTNMSNMFADTYDLSNLNISSFNTLNVTDMSGMFGGVSMFAETKMITLDLNNFDTSKVTNISKMFENTNVRKLNLSNWNIKNINVFEFGNNSYIKELNISNWKIPIKHFEFFDTFNNLEVLIVDNNALSISSSSLFSNLKNVTTISLNNVDTSEVVDMRYMFSNSPKIKLLDLSSFDTSNVVSMREMFSNCTNLEAIKVSEKFVYNRNNIFDNNPKMFYNATKLVGLYGKKYDSNIYNSENSDDSIYAKIGQVNDSGYFTDTFDEPFKIEMNDIELNVNKKIKINPIVFPSFLPKIDLDYIIDDETVATIDENEILIGLKRGNTILTIKSSNGREVKCIITVLDPKVLSITLENDEYWFNYDDNKIVSFNFDMTLQDNPTYSVGANSSNMYVAYLTDIDTNNRKIYMKILNPGETIISISAGDIKKEVTINVYRHINSVNISNKDLSLVNGSRYPLNVTIGPNDATDDKTITWYSEDDNIATVDSNGVVSAVSSGTTKIIARTSNGLEASCLVKVLSKISTKTSYGSTILVKNSAMNGEQVDININVNDGFKLSDVRILNAKTNEDITNEVNFQNNSFIMPNYNVIIDVRINQLTLVYPFFDIFKGDNNSILLKWEMQEADYYYIHRSTNKKKWYKIDKISNDDHYLNTNLTYGTKYYYKVTACNTYSGCITSSIDGMIVVPNKVTNLRIDGVTSTSVKLSYDKVNVTGYEVYYGTSSSKMSSAGTVTSNNTLTYNKTGLKANTTYYFKVRAYKTVGRTKVYGNFSDIISVKTGPSAPSISVSNKDYKTLNVKINSVTGATLYKLEVSTDNKNYSVVDEFESATTYEAKDLTSGTTYYYRVQAFNVEGSASSYSSVVSKKVIPLTPTITVTRSADNKVLVKANEQEGVDGYRVYRSTSKTKNYKFVGSTNTEEYTDTLTYGTTYYYKVVAFNEGSSSGYSNIVSIKVLPEKVNNLVSDTVNSTSIKLVYDKVNVTGYEVYYGTSTKKMKNAKTITSGDTLSYIKTGLKANTTYYFKVRAYKKVGSKKIYGSFSDVLTVKTSPSSPKVTLSIKEYNEMNINISKVSGAVKYIVEKSLDGNEYTLVEELPEEGVLAQSGLEVGKTYYFRVKACNVNEHCSGWVTVSKVQTTKVPEFTLSTASKTVTATLTSVSEADGYELYRSNYSNKKFSIVKEFTKEDELLEYVSSTSKGKTYYFKVRSYKVVDEVKVYSDYSSVKSIKSK